MHRRNFMQSILALGMAPAIVRAESLMRIKPVLLPGVDFQFTSQDLSLSFTREDMALSIDEFIDRSGITWERWMTAQRK